MAKFDPQTYTEFRIAYPARLFECLKPYWSQLQREASPLHVVDLGAGTGMSSVSFLEVFPDALIRLIEPDEGMRAQIPRTLGKFEASAQVEGDSAETFAMKPRAHLFLIGSAWHWMDRPVVTERICEALEAGGLVYVFEYQFPKALDGNAMEVNEWVRRKFNTDWRPSIQTPRGNLEELTEVLRIHSLMSQRARVDFKSEVLISLNEFKGVIRSQSRYLAYEKLHPEVSREGWETELKNMWGKEGFRRFFYPFEGFLFQKRC